MMTPDKDYGQLVSENVFMYRPKHSGGFEVMGIEEISEVRYSVHRASHRHAGTDGRLFR